MIASTHTNTPAVGLQTARFHDADTFSAAVFGAQAEITQLAPTQRSWDVRRAVLPSLTITRGHTGAATLLIGAAGTEVQVFLLQRHQAPIHYRSRELQNGDIGIHGPGTDYFGSCASGHGFTVISLDPRSIVEALQPLRPEFRPNVMQGYSLATLSPPSWVACHSAIQAAEAALQVEDATTPDALRWLEQALLDALFEGILDGQPDLSRDTPTPAAQLIIMRRIRKYIQPVPNAPLTLADLCRIADTGLRNLQYTFRRTLNISPAQFLRYRRLQRVHRLLREAAVPSVKSAALKHGFLDLGRFSLLYKKVFGELPSTTLMAGRSVLGPHRVAHERR